MGQVFYPLEFVSRLFISTKIDGLLIIYCFTGQKALEIPPARFVHSSTIPNTDLSFPTARGQDGGKLDP